MLRIEWPEKRKREGPKRRFMDAVREDMAVVEVRPLARDALQRYCNAILKNCNAIFDFQITLFYVFIT